MGLILLFLITASGVFAYSAAKSHQAKPVLSVETALKAIDFAAENDISIDSEFSANLRQSIDFNRNRYYSPALGRFISKDPISFSGGMNLYRYADNNPIRYTDPMGLVAFYRFVQLWPGEGIFRSDFNPCLPNYWLEFVVKNNVGQLQQEVVYQANDLFSDPDFMNPTDPSRLDEFLGNIDASHKNRLREILQMAPGDANEAYDALNDYTKMRLGITYSSYWY